MKLRIAAAALAISLIGAAAPALAADAAGGEKGRVMGLRLEGSLTSDFNLVGPGALSPGYGLFGAAGGASASVKPSGAVRIGYDLPFGLTPLLGIGFRSVSQEIVVEPPTGDATTQTFSGTEVVLALELRYYLKKHKKGLQPFFFGEIDTSFLSGSVTDDTDGADDAVDAANEDLGYRADAADHTEIDLGFGAEYKFSKYFGVGGKWGLGIGMKPFTRNDPVGADDQAVTTVSDTTIGLSSTIYAAWRM